MERYTKESTMVSSYRTWHTCRYEQFTKRQGNLESRMHRNGARPVRRGEVCAASALVRFLPEAGKVENDTFRTAPDLMGKPKRGQKHGGKAEKSEGM